MKYAPSYGCNVWARTTNFTSPGTSSAGEVTADSNLKIYLNGTYYDSITTNKTAIENYVFYYGAVTTLSDNLTTMIREEKAFSAQSYIGLINVSDYLKANTNNSCNTYKTNNDNYSICKNTNYMANIISNNSYWPINSRGGNEKTPTSDFPLINYDGRIYWNDGNPSNDDHAGASHNVIPAIYLKSNIHLEGSGKQDEPYTIVES